MTIWIISMLASPLATIPMAAAWEAGDEAAIFGHTFTEEYWTNSSVEVKDTVQNNTAYFTASYVHVDEFSAFLVAFNKLIANDSKEFMLPYQLFGMHYYTPDDKEIFIGAVLAFFMVHIDNKTVPELNNGLPDVGNETAWYVLPISSLNPWNDVTPTVEPIAATKLGENHYRFGMRYYNMSARVVDANSPGGFFVSLLIPLVTVLISEIVVQYDIFIDPVSGEIHTETLYSFGQVTRARVFLDLFEVDPQDIINETMSVTAVHYLSVFTSNYGYSVTNSGTGNTLVPPTATTPMDDNITIRVGNDNERAFDIGLGRQYALINETTNPWTTVSDNETAVNALLGARASDFLLIAWQAPLSAFIFAHAAYGLSEDIRAEFDNPADLAQNYTTSFHSSQWWYAVSFPEWNGLRIQQDPVYVAYSRFTPASTEPTTTTTPTTTPTTTGEGDGAGGLIFLGIIAVAVVGIIICIKRR